MKTLTELRNQNLYDRLEIQPDANTQDIIKAYKKASLKYHPDKNPSADSDAQFQCITESLNLLQDVDYRASYDALLNNSKNTNITSIYSDKRKLESINLVCNTMKTYQIDYTQSFFNYLTHKKIDEHLKIINVLKVLRDCRVSKKDVHNALNNMDLLIRGDAYASIQEMNTDELTHPHRNTSTNEKFLLQLITSPSNATEINKSRNAFIEQDKNPSFSHVILNYGIFNNDSIDTSPYETASEATLDCLAKPVIAPLVFALAGIAGIGSSLLGAIASTKTLIDHSGSMDRTRFSLSAGLFIHGLTALAAAPVVPVLCLGQAVVKSVSTLNAAMSYESANETSTELTLLNPTSASEESNVSFSL